jgi:hypothetical protein
MVDIQGIHYGSGDLSEDRLGELLVGGRLGRIRAGIRRLLGTDVINNVRQCQYLGIHLMRLGRYIPICICICSRQLCRYFERDHWRERGAATFRFCGRRVGMLLPLLEDSFQGRQSSFGRRLGAPMQTLSICICICIRRCIAVGCGIRKANSRFLVVPMQVGIGGIRSIRNIIIIIIRDCQSQNIMATQFLELGKQIGILTRPFQSSS